MTSLFAQLFLAIQNQIQREVPEIKWIDQDLGQLEWYEDRPAVQWPCVLIEFPDAQYNDESQYTQWMAIAVQIRLGFAPFTSANGIAPDISKEAALQFYEIENKLYQALQNFDVNGTCQPMTRVRVGSELRKDDPYRVRVMQFTTATEDNSAEIAKNTTKTSLKITTEME